MRRDSPITLRLTESMPLPEGRKGRGATANPTGRFETARRGFR